MKFTDYDFINDTTLMHELFFVWFEANILVTVAMKNDHIFEFGNSGGNNSSQ